MKKYSLLIALFLLCVSFQNTRPIKWVAIGDSITYLNDHLDEAGNRVTKGYLSRVVDQLPQVSYINQGHNGWTASGIAKEIDKLGLVKADLYTVFLGTNDWWSGIPVGTLNDYMENKGTTTLYGSFRVIIDKVKSLNKDAKIILITPMQRVDFVYLFDAKNNAYGSYKAKNGQTLKQFADAVKSIGKYAQVKVVDVYNEPSLSEKHLVKYKRLKDPKTGEYVNFPYPKFINIPFNPETDEYPYPPPASAQTYDGLHPSDQGNQIIAKMLVKEIRALKFNN